MKALSRIWPPPSLLARKVLCTAYVSAPFDSESVSKFHGLHASAAMRVISRHLKLGYKLDSIEKRGAGFRTDLIFTKPNMGSRLVEVKSANRLREVHQIQAALYPNDRYNEIVVSNRHQDLILTPEYIEEARGRAHLIREFLAHDPEKAAIKYTPHEDVCYTCANESCPFNGLHKQNEVDPPPDLPFYVDYDSDL